MLGKPWGRWLLVLSWCGGCDDEDPSAAQSVCGGVCQTARRCAEVTSVSECAQDCVERTTGLDRLSPSAANTYGDCLGGADCSLLYGEETEYERCWESAKDRAEVSAQTRQFCAAFVDTLFLCGEDWVPSSCERSMAIYTGPFLDLLSSCLTGDCEADVSCVESVFAQ